MLMTAGVWCRPACCRLRGGCKHEYFILFLKRQINVLQTIIITAATDKPMMSSGVTRGLGIEPCKSVLSELFRISNINLASKIAINNFGRYEISP